jgi:hypothetical protein
MKISLGIIFFFEMCLKVQVISLYHSTEYLQFLTNFPKQLLKTTLEEFVYTFDKKYMNLTMNFTINGGDVVVDVDFWIVQEALKVLVSFHR